MEALMAWCCILTHRQTGIAETWSGMGIWNLKVHPKLTSFNKGHAYSNKATPLNPSNPQTGHQLGTMYTMIWAQGVPFSFKPPHRVLYRHSAGLSLFQAAQLVFASSRLFSQLVSAPAGLQGWTLILWDSWAYLRVALSNLYCLYILAVGESYWIWSVSGTSWSYFDLFISCFKAYPWSISLPP